MTLYEITNDILYALSKIEDIQDDENSAEELQAWKDSLDGVKMEFSLKAENTAAYIKNLNADIAACKAEEDAIRKRRKAKENAVKHMKDYLLQEMDMAGISKIDRPRAAISIKNNPESVMIDNENDFIDWAQKNNHDDLLTFKAPEISKTAVKNFIKENKDTPFVHIERTRSVIIK